MSVHDVQLVLQQQLADVRIDNRYKKLHANKPIFISKVLWPYFTYRILRNNKHLLVPIHNLLTGDTIDLKAGDIVPAVIRLTQSRSLAVDESALFASHAPVYKNTFASKELLPETAQKNMLFPGSRIIGGAAKGIVVETTQNFPYIHAIKTKAFASADATHKVVSSIKHMKSRLRSVSFVVFDGISPTKAKIAKEQLLQRKGISVVCIGTTASRSGMRNGDDIEQLGVATAYFHYYENCTEKHKIATVQTAQQQGHDVLYYSVSGSTLANLAADIAVTNSTGVSQASMLQADIVTNYTSIEWLLGYLYNKK